MALRPYGAAHEKHLSSYPYHKAKKRQRIIAGGGSGGEDKIVTAFLTLQIEGVEDLQDPKRKNDLETVCKYVLKIFETKVAKVPPLGVKPIVIRPAPDNTPRLCRDVRFLAEQYPINLTASCLTNGRFYCQLVYQFAHELCHVYMLPHDWDQVAHFMPTQPDENEPWNNWFAESMCTTMSYLCLRMMPEEWKRQPPRFSNWIIYAPNFIQYRGNIINGCLGRLSIPSENKAAEWVRSELPTLVETCTERDRAEQSACAIVLEQAFLKYEKGWGAICTLGDSIDRPTTDFKRWKELTTIKKQRELVKALSQTFDPKHVLEAQLTER